MRIGLIGCGAIGQFLLEKVNREKVLPGFTITSLLDERLSAKDKLHSVCASHDVTLVQQVGAFLDGPVDLIVECANVEAVKTYATHVLTKKPFVVVSVGAFVDESFYRSLQQLAEENGTTLYIPTGAIGGVDLVQAANTLGRLEQVKLISKKPAAALTDRESNEAIVLFDGTAAEAIEKFPKNINVSITLALAGVGMERTMVEVIQDPTQTRNSHSIEIIGAFGRATLQIENEPLPTNPKTSMLTALSILQTLKQVKSHTKIG